MEAMEAMGASYLCYVLSNTVTSVYVGSAGLLWLWSERNGTAAEVGGLPEAARVGTGTGAFVTKYIQFQCR